MNTSKIIPIIAILAAGATVVWGFISNWTGLFYLPSIIGGFAIAIAAVIGSGKK